MIKFHTLSVSKVFALLLSFLLVSGHIVWAERVVHAAHDVTKEYSSQKKSSLENKASTNNSIEDIFFDALEEFNNGMVEQAKTRLESILSLLEKAAPNTRAKVYLLLGACYEESGKKTGAKNYFLELKRLVGKGLIDQVPAVAGIETGAFSQYREVFEKNEFFKYRDPTSVSEMMDKNTIHARKAKVKKKKKKLSWLLALAGTAAAVGTVVLLVYLKKQRDKKKNIPEIEWVQIPAGEFLMGDNFNEGDADEQPVHTVYLDEYYISKYEISVEAYFSFCEDTDRKKLIPVTDGPPSSTDIPMYRVPWGMANAFCEWLSGKTGENIRLPTEAQWEKAARGTHQYRYPWGNSSPDDNKAYYNKDVDEGSAVNSHPAGVSPYGVYHMAGNIAEWCRDWYSSTYYSESPKNNPTGPTGGAARVIRGGNHGDDADGIRSANRHADHPDRWGNIGFRIVKEKKE